MSSATNEGDITWGEQLRVCHMTVVHASVVGLVCLHIRIKDSSNQILKDEDTQIVEDIGIKCRECMEG